VKINSIVILVSHLVTASAVFAVVHYGGATELQAVCCDSLALQVRGLGLEILIHSLLHHWQMLEVRAANWTIR